MSREVTSNEGQFDEILSIIDDARTRALKSVNAELRCIGMSENIFPDCAPIPDLAIKLLTKLRHMSQRQIQESKDSIAEGFTA